MQLVRKFYRNYVLDLLRKLRRELQCLSIQLVRRIWGFYCDNGHNDGQTDRQQRERRVNKLHC